jgi:hypothetical protein
MSRELQLSIKQIQARLSAIEQRQSRDGLMMLRRRLIQGGGGAAAPAPAAEVPSCRFVKYTTGGTT